MPKSALQESFLMMTNVRLEDRIPKEFYQVSTFHDAGKSFNWARYLPLKDTPLPVNWSLAGNYHMLGHLPQQSRACLLRDAPSIPRNTQNEEPLESLLPFFMNAWSGLSTLSTQIRRPSPAGLCDADVGIAYHLGFFQMKGRSLADGEQAPLPSMPRGGGQALRCILPFTHAHTHTGTLLQVL